MAQRADLVARIDEPSHTPLQDLIELVGRLRKVFRGLNRHGRRAATRQANDPQRLPAGSLWGHDVSWALLILPHIHHNRLDLHILIHPLLTTFTA
jgi:hypothetical protein